MLECIQTVRIQFKPFSNVHSLPEGFLLSADLVLIDLDRTKKNERIVLKNEEWFGYFALTKIESKL